MDKLDGRLVSLIRHGTVEDFLAMMTGNGGVVSFTGYGGNYCCNWRRIEGGSTVTYGGHGNSLLDAILGALELALTLSGEGGA
jgi:hypothetical protein